MRQDIEVGLTEVRMASAHDWMDDRMGILSPPLTLDTVGQPVELARQWYLGVIWCSWALDFTIPITLFAGADNIVMKFTLPTTPFMNVSCMIFRQISHPLGILAPILTLLKAAEVVYSCPFQETVRETATARFVAGTLALGWCNLREFVSVSFYHVIWKGFLLGQLLQVVDMRSSDMASTFEYLTLRVVLFHRFCRTRVSVLPHHLHSAAFSLGLAIAFSRKNAFHWLRCPFK